MTLPGAPLSSAAVPAYVLMGVCAILSTCLHAMAPSLDQLWCQVRCSAFSLVRRRKTTDGCAQTSRAPSALRSMYYMDGSVGDRSRFKVSHCGSYVYTRRYACRRSKLCGCVAHDARLHNERTPVRCPA
jgi:hypothetical protein